MARSKTSGLFFHLLSLLFVLMAVILLSLTVFMNIPLPAHNDITDPNVHFRAWLITLRQKDDSELLNVDIQYYGFGIWGWCEWLANPLNLHWPVKRDHDDISDGYCVNKVFWELPRDSLDADSIRRLDLPECVMKQYPTLQS